MSVASSQDNASSCGSSSAWPWPSLNQRAARSWAIHLADNASNTSTRADGLQEFADPDIHKVNQAENFFMSVLHAPEFVPRDHEGYPEHQAKGRGAPGRGTRLAPVFEDGNPGNQAKGRKGRGRGQGRKGKRREAPPAAPPLRLMATSIESAGVEPPTAPGTRATPHPAAKDQSVGDSMQDWSSMKWSSMKKHELSAADNARMTTLSALNIEPRAASFPTRKPVRKHEGTETNPRLLAVGKTINALNLEPSTGYFPTKSEIRAAISGSASTAVLLSLHPPSGSGGSGTAPDA